MPSRIYSRFPERKITNPNPPADPKPGDKGTIKEKTANWPGLPGPAQPRSRATVPKVKIYPSSDGLYAERPVGSARHWAAHQEQAQSY